MEVPRRRQNHSCDQCRRGKRACDAVGPPEGKKNRISKPNAANSIGSCSNCKKWKKQCTFHWLKSTPEERTRKDPRCRPRTNETNISSIPFRTYHGTPGLDPQTLSQWSTQSPDSGVWSLDGTSSPEINRTTPSNILGQRTTEDSSYDGIPLIDQYMDIPNPDTTGCLNLEEELDSFDPRDLSMLSELKPDEDTEVIDQSDFGSLSFKESSPNNALLALTFRSADGVANSSHQHKNQYSSPYDRFIHETGKILFSSASDLTVNFVRSSVNQTLVRIYHDSMENALSCWLTERNCPYSGIIGSRKSKRSTSQANDMENEWGSNWSNRICARVCSLDREFAQVRGRSLTATEDKHANRTLHTVIMAFATQWTQHTWNGGFPTTQPLYQKKTSSPASHRDGQPSTSDLLDRSVHEDLWYQARNALNDSVEIPSFRIIFAYIIFSLTQRPLNIRDKLQSMESDSVQGQTSEDLGQVELEQLLDADSAPMFLDVALRQLYSYRSRLTRSIRQNSGPNKSKTGLLDPEAQETFNLLFWLGVMFDTLTSAMHQRPLVVSDEDSELSCVKVENQVPGGIDLDGLNLGSDLDEKDDSNLWGDLFLRGQSTNRQSKVLRWPCSYEEAADLLSKAAPVKVLLFRRVTRLQTLTYRGATSQQIESAIEDTLHVYQQWNRTYGHFMHDCMTHHDDLPPRIQSWYIVLAGHWHLAAILLADTLENIDKSHLGLDEKRTSRQATGLKSILRHENAVAISDIAGCSLRSPDHSFSHAREFHHAVNEGAFLTEPWTAVLIRSLTRAGYILLDEVDVQPSPIHLPQNDPTEDACRRCQVCVDALYGLGRKSDVSYLAARTMSNSLNERMRQRSLMQMSAEMSGYYTAKRGMSVGLADGVDQWMTPSSMESLLV